MSYLHDRNQRHRKIRIGFIIAGFFLILLFAVTSFISKTSGVALAIGRPIWSLEEHIGSGLLNVGAFFKSKKSLNQENQLLTSLLSEANLRVLDRDAISLQNEELKADFDRKPEGDFVLASVLVKPPVSLYDTLILDIGTNAGIKKDDKVFAFGNILIGRITDVYAHTSKALLFSTAGEHFTGRMSDLGIDVDMIGRGGGGFEVSFPRDVVIIKGVSVVSSGLTPYVVAIVGDTISDARDPFQKVLLQSPVNMQELRFVQVERGVPAQ